MIKDYILIGFMSFSIFYFPIMHYSNVDAKPVKNINKVENTIERKIDKKYFNYEFAKYPYKVSIEGQNFIKEHESLRLERYLIKGESKYTIGWGHQILKHEKIGSKITLSKAQELFDNDIDNVNESINRLMKPFQKRKFKFSQEFIDGLGSLIFNCGETGVKNSEFYKTLLKCRKDKNEPPNINKRDIEFALSKIKNTHVYFNGHKKRRTNEYRLMSKL